MSNIVGQVFSFGTAAFGVGEMNNHDFTPTSLFFYMGGMFLLCFLAGMVGDEIEKKFKKPLKEKWDGIGR